MGPSPPTRGSPDPVFQHDPVFGSIPAHAGKPCPSPGPPAAPRVHPRPRGEASTGGSHAEEGGGPSPPTRGSLPDTIARGFRARSIPAHAGKPTYSASPFIRASVHPRPRGEATAASPVDRIFGGPSPPTRGSPRSPRARLAAEGSIPAHAGKPPTARDGSAGVRVHPRPRGEALRAAAGLSSSAGPSPPTRGSRSAARRKAVPCRSIPAHAGKPLTYGQFMETLAVHPRPRGEAIKSRWAATKD